MACGKEEPPAAPGIGPEEAVAGEREELETPVENEPLPPLADKTIPLICYLYAQNVIKGIK